MKNKTNTTTGLGNLLNKTNILGLLLAVAYMTEPIDTLPQEPIKDTTKIVVKLDSKYKHTPGDEVTTFIKLDVGLYVQTTFSHTDKAEINKEMLDDGTLIYYISEATVKSKK